ncbi:MAG: recombinase family protein [Betaproteobacteria bacterium]|nr:recombinase family protein [Betaproteobacteria bacterium]
MHQQALDTSTPSAKAMLGMPGVCAELERSIIHERVKATLAGARSRRRTLGRTRVIREVEDRVRRLASQGTGGVKTGRMHGVGVSVVQRVLDAAKRPDRAAGRADPPNCPPAIEELATPTASTSDRTSARLGIEWARSTQPGRRTLRMPNVHNGDVSGRCSRSAVATRNVKSCRPTQPQAGLAANIARR